MEVLDSYIKSAPNSQNALDIFKGEWASMFPSNASLVAGTVPLFEDNRVAWAIEKFNGVQNKHIVELGPLEAGHTYMLEKYGAASITAIEANSRAYLKCLIVKEVMQLQKAHFLYGDCVEYLRTSHQKFDVCWASGILYHMTNPVELISLIAQASDQVFIWTHYYDGDIIHNQPHLSPKFPAQLATEYEGFNYTAYRQEYQVALNYAGYCGGNSAFSHWLSREDILSCLKYFGLTQIQVNFEHLDHPSGPSFALVAMRS
ncbi:class I SAM-dependent methyltransferase [Microcoleus sp. AT9b-C5]|uniref:class I SAM-dependent methyltransferase n=1 Tax=unclassified Microcoleus TaxID=2642155 RepID=UPI002FD3560B